MAEPTAPDLNSWSLKGVVANTPPAKDAGRAIQLKSGWFVPEAGGGLGAGIGWLRASNDSMTHLTHTGYVFSSSKHLMYECPIVFELDGKIVVTLAAFKQHCAIWFHQGALLSDKSNKLINAQEGKTKDMRHWRFAIDDKPNKRLIKSYVSEAIKNQRAVNKDKTVKKGTTGKPQTRKLSIPDELNAALKKDKKLATAFKALTPGRQREYAGHVADAKQEKTRLSRTVKITPMILAGVGLHDKYRNC